MEICDGTISNITDKQFCIFDNKKIENISNNLEIESEILLNNQWIWAFKYITP